MSCPLKPNPANQAQESGKSEGFFLLFKCSDTEKKNKVEFIILGYLTRKKLFQSRHQDGVFQHMGRFKQETEVLSSAREGLSTVCETLFRPVIIHPPNSSRIFLGFFGASKNNPETTNETTKISDQTFSKRKKTDLRMPTGPPTPTHLQIEVLHRIHISL